MTVLLGATTALAQPANDNCPQAVPIKIGETAFGTTAAAADDPVPFCDVGSVAPGVWYSVIGDGSKFTVEVCGDQVGPVVSVYCGGCSELGCIGGEDWGSAEVCAGRSLDWCTEPGAEYLILVHGLIPEDHGAFGLTVTSDLASCPRGAPCLEVTAPTNDECEDAIAIEGVGEFPFSLVGATMTPGYGQCGDDLRATAGDVWFQWTAQRERGVTLEICGDATSPIQISVYEGCSCPPSPIYVECGVLRPTYCSGTGFWRVQFEASEGQCYLLQVGSTTVTTLGIGAEGGGNGVLTVTHLEPVAPPCSLNDYTTETCSPRGASDGLSSTRPHEVVAENFRPMTYESIYSVCFWGTYFNGTAGDCQLPIPDEFVITYYSDDCGIPGEIIGGPFHQHLDHNIFRVEGPAPTGRKLANGLPEYEYSAEHATRPVAVSADTDYWIEISNYQAFDCRWYWATTDSTTGFAYQDGLHGDGLDGFTSDEHVASDLSLCMNATHEFGRPACIAPPYNDECEYAEPIDVGWQRFVTVGATHDPMWDADLPGERCDFPLGDEAVSGDVWFEHVAECTGRLRVGTCDSNYDSKLAVYRAPSCAPNEAEMIVCDDDTCGAGDPPIQAEVMAEVTEGERYLIRVGGYRGATGAGTLSVYYAPPEAAHLVDYAYLSRCFTGPCLGDVCNPPLYEDPCCSIADFDEDGDVDLGDYGFFKDLLAGP